MAKTNNVLGTLFFLVIVIGCVASSHEHNWIEATCTEPRTCSECKQTEGEPLGHKWLDATCSYPQTCSVCGVTHGRRKEHSWLPATCTNAETCSVCGKTPIFSAPKGHKWIDATCTTPKKCSVCGITEGVPKGHCSISSITYTEPTCQTEGSRTFICSDCNEFCTETIPIFEHNAGDWQIVSKATPSTDGTQKRYCRMCGIEMDSRQYPYIDLFGTDEDAGTGNRSNFNTYNDISQQETSASYVLNTSSHKFHYSSCRSVPKISPKNYSTSNSSRDSLISQGYSPCGICNP